MGPWEGTWERERAGPLQASFFSMCLIARSLFFPAQGCTRQWERIFTLHGFFCDSSSLFVVDGSNGAEVHHGASSVAGDKWSDVAF